MPCLHHEPWPEIAGRAAAQPPGKAFLVGPDARLTYGELETRIRRLTTLYGDRGLTPGSRVMLAVRSDVEAVTLFLSLVRNGLVPMVMNPEATPHEARALFALSRPDGVILDAESIAAWGLEAFAGFSLPVRPAPRKTLIAKLLGRKAEEPAKASSYPAGLELWPERAPSARPSCCDPAYVLFTSGTTATPKGVVVSHGAMDAHLRTLGRQFGYGEQTRLMNGLPLYHTDGLMHGPMAAYLAGATVVRPPAFSIQTLQPVLDTLYRERVTHMVAVPTMLALIDRLGDGLEASFATEDFKQLISTAAALDSDLWTRFEARFGIRVSNVYGLTETVSGSFFSGPDDQTRRVGTIGRPVDCLARVIDEAGAELAPGEVGELALSGPHLMSGYLADPESTARVLQDGWLRTGDLARQDAKGFWRIVGRAKHVIVSGGRNLSPEEIGEVLRGYPGALDAAVLGVPDPLLGEKIVACVLTAGGEALDAEALAAHCRARLSAYKVPGRFVFMPDLPRGPSGKVRVEVLRDRLAATPAPGPGLPEAALTEALFRVAARVFQVPEASLSLASGPQDTPGWSSLAQLELVVAIEREFGVAFSVRELMTVDSLGAALALTRGHLAAGRPPA